MSDEVLLLYEDYREKEIREKLIFRRRLIAKQLLHSSLSLQHSSGEDLVRGAFHELYGREAAVVARAPGRVVLLGAHVDYNEGWVLPAAVDQSVWLAAAPATNHMVTIQALNFGQKGAFSLPNLDRHASVSIPPWLNYPMGVAWALQEAGHALVGMDVVLASDVPMRAGMSSSAAVEMAFVLAWEALSGFQLDDLVRARLGQRVENAYLGIGSGIMDQFASLRGKAEHLILLDCRSLEYELIPLPPGTAVLVADSGVRRALTQINYNSRPQECREATAILRQYLPDIRTLRDVTPEAFAAHAHYLPEVLRRRARHAVEECARVLAGAAALRRGDLTTFGCLMRQSQISSCHNYENSIPELELLAATAWQTPGCYGARFGGAGFGGCMQILAERSAVPAIQQALAEAFEKEFGREPSIFTSTIADGASVTRC